MRSTAGTLIVSVLLATGTAFAAGAWPPGWRCRRKTLASWPRAGSPD